MFRQEKCLKLPIFNFQQCTGPVNGMIEDKKVEVCKIYRFIVEECGIEHHSVTVLTIYGKQDHMDIFEYFYSITLFLTIGY